MNSMAVLGVTTQASRVNLPTWITDHLDRYDDGPKLGSSSLPSIGTAVDFAMEEFHHLTPEQSYNTFKNGVDEIVEMAVPHVITDLYQNGFNVGCSACRLGTWGARSFLDNKVTAFVINEAAVFLCDVFIFKLTGY